MIELHVNMHCCCFACWYFFNQAFDYMMSTLLTAFKPQTSFSLATGKNFETLETTLPKDYYDLHADIFSSLPFSVPENYFSDQKLTSFYLYNVHQHLSKLAIRPNSFSLTFCDLFLQIFTFLQTR